MNSNQQNSDKKNRKYRLLQTINKIMIGIGVLFLFYLAYAYYVYFTSLPQVK
ncbi:MAG: hypothetical protein JXO49_07600 [Deltaproteobacteria bacterium]|nr:hypothetical protein [Candidatus Anaeroferrophillus wilburensis]MBN2889192.1 hypothetical protein [Deltaproteobacteria bacterium]